MHLTGGDIEGGYAQQPVPMCKIRKLFTSHERCYQQSLLNDYIQKQAVKYFSTQLTGLLPYL
jgi:hypothetical protein